MFKVVDEIFFVLIGDSATVRIFEIHDSVHFAKNTNVMYLN